MGRGKGGGGQPGQTNGFDSTVGVALLYGATKPRAGLLGDRLGVAGEVGGLLIAFNGLPAQLLPAVAAGHQRDGSALLLRAQPQNLPHRGTFPSHTLLLAQAQLYLLCTLSNIENVGFPLCVTGPATSDGKCCTASGGRGEGGGGGGVSYTTFYVEAIECRRSDALTSEQNWPQGAMCPKASPQRRR